MYYYKRYSETANEELRKLWEAEENLFYGWLTFVKDEKIYREVVERQKRFLKEVREE